jgi:hypothetical protein
VAPKTFRELIISLKDMPRINITLSDKNTLNARILDVLDDYIMVQALNFDKMSQTYRPGPEDLNIPIENIVMLKALK